MPKIIIGKEEGATSVLFTDFRLFRNGQNWQMIFLYYLEAGCYKEISYRRVLQVDVNADTFILKRCKECTKQEKKSKLVEHWKC